MADQEEPEVTRCCLCEKFKPMSVQIGNGGALCRACAIEYRMLSKSSRRRR